MRKPLFPIILLFALAIGASIVQFFDGPPPCNPRVQVCPNGRR